MEAFKKAIESQTQQDIHPYTVPGDEMASYIVALLLRLNKISICNKISISIHAARKET